MTESSQNQPLVKPEVENTLNVNASKLVSEEISNTQPTVLEDETDYIPKTGVECYRWLILACFYGQNASIGILQTGFSAITTNTATAFGISDSYVEFIGLTYLILFAPTDILYTFAYRKLPMSLIMRTNALCQIVGAWIRMLCLLKGTFTWVVIGNVIAAWSGAPLQMATIKVAERWFGPKERNLAVAGQSFASIVGGLAGFIIAPFLVGDDASLGDVQTYIFVQCIIVTIFSLPSVIFFTNKPKIPASLSSDIQQTTSSKEDFVTLMKNKNFHLLLWNATTSQVIYDLLSILVDPLTAGIYGSFQVVGITIAFVFVGIAGLVVFSLILDKYKKFLLVQIIWSWGSTVFMVAAALLLKTGIYPLFVFVIGMAGFFVIPQSSAALAFAAEVTFPVEASMVNGVVTLIGHSVSALVGIGCTQLTSKSQVGTLWFFAALTFIGAVLTIFMTEDLRRHKYEQSKAIEKMVKDGVSQSETLVDEEKVK